MVPQVDWLADVMMLRIVPVGLICAFVAVTAAATGYVNLAENLLAVWAVTVLVAFVGAMLLVALELTY
jgi:small-conductance mechanosensitive channel